MWYQQTVTGRNTFFCINIERWTKQTRKPQVGLKFPWHLALLYLKKLRGISYTSLHGAPKNKSLKPKQGWILLNSYGLQTCVRYTKKEVFRKFKEMDKNYDLQSAFTWIYKVLKNTKNVL